MSSQTNQSPELNRAESGTILFPGSYHGSQFQFTELFNRYLTEFVDR